MAPRSTLPSTLASLLQRVEQAHPSGRLRRIWREVVGDRVAARSQARWLNDQQVLTVDVASAVWAQELALLSDTILVGLRERGVAARRLRFQVTNLGLPKPNKPAAERKLRVPRAALPAELLMRLERLDDPELAGRLRDAAELTLARSAELGSEQGKTRKGR